MKKLKYLFAALTLLAASCKSDPTDGTALTGLREALLSSDEMGIYENGSAALRFDKTAHQLSVSPAEYRFRIMDNQGFQYVEITLGAMPQEGKSVSARLTSTGFNLQDRSMQDVVLLRRDGDQLWLWSDAAHTGMILPWIEL